MKRPHTLGLLSVNARTALAAHHRPVLLVHETWLHATSSTPWVELLTSHRPPATAPGWPGEAPTVAEARKPTTATGVGLVELVEHFGRIARAMPRRPVVVGHGFGALVAELLLGRGDAWAAVSIEPAVVRGPMPMSWPQLAAGSLFLDRSARPTRSTSLRLTAAQFRLVFGTALGAATSQDLHRTWCIPAPARPLADAATGGLRNLTEPPRLAPRRHPVLTGDSDRLAPAPLVRTNLPGTSDTRPAVRRLPGRGHTLVVDPGWTDVAYAVLTWLNEIDPLAPTSTRTSTRPNTRPITHPQEVLAMNDNEILARIHELVTAEHQQRDHASATDSTQQPEAARAENRAELRDLEGTLDQCWDLLRQRRARREFGQDPDSATVRPRGQVEHYLQ